MNQFFREYSQIIASLAVSGYAIIMMNERFSVSSRKQDPYMFQDEAEKYLDLSPDELKRANKLLYRMRLDANSYENLKFFRSNTIDCISLGYLALRESSHIGLSISFLAKNIDDVKQYSPPKGYMIGGELITHEKLKQSLEQSGDLEKFYETLLLGDEAKQFCLSLALARSSQALNSNIDIIVDCLLLAIAYVYTYARSRKLRLNTIGRRLLALRMGIVTVACVCLARYFIYKYNDTCQDQFACALGLDVCEGSLEYYGKEIERNKLLRRVLNNGADLIDSEGNYARQSIWLPFISSSPVFYMNYFGKPLTQRRDDCAKILNETAQKLSKDLLQDENELNQPQQQSKQPVAYKNRSEKEWEIFRKLREKLTDSKNKSTNE